MITSPTGIIPRRAGGEGWATDVDGGRAPGRRRQASRVGAAGHRGVGAASRAHLIRLRNSCHALALNSRTGPRPFAFVSRTPTTEPAPSRAEASSTQLLPSPL